jgi:3'(2'), 5'-bisphosphate nucleotidase
MIQKIINIAQEASLAILGIYEDHDIDVILKDDCSPLTQADVISNEIIVKGLQQISPYPIQSEERQIPYEIRKTWDYYWLVDPLDGTKDFIARNGEFTINIALMHKSTPLIGVVYVPTFHDVYYAQKGEGAYKNGQKIFNRSQRKEWIGADSNFHSTDVMKEFFTEHHISDIRKYGSSIKICKLAEGEIDVYPRLNETKEWDTAACHVIANEAGCKLVDIITHEELVYNKPSIKNNFFVASRNDLDFMTELQK